MNLEFPDADRLRAANDATAADLPRVAVARRHRDPPTVDDVGRAARDAVDAIDAFGADEDALPTGSEVAVTAGSRGIHDMPAVLAAAVAELRERGYEPFVLPAMGSHGGATAEGQREKLNTLGVSEETVGCEIRATMEVETVGETPERGVPVYADANAVAADAIVMVNRIKPHTDFSGEV